MAERIYKGTADINGVNKPVTYKIVNAPESRANDLAFIKQFHDNHQNIKLAQVYDSDRPSNYGSLEELAKYPDVAPQFMTPLPPPADADPNPGNVPPREASIPPANAPTGDVPPRVVPVAPQETGRVDKPR